MHIVIVHLKPLMFVLFYRMSGRNSNSSDIIPQVKFLQLFMRQAGEATSSENFRGLGCTVAALQASMDKRFSKYLEHDSLILSTFLDPRYKDSLYDKSSSSSSSTNIENIEAKIIEQIKTRKMQIAESEAHVENLCPNESSSENGGSEAGEADTSENPDTFEFDFDSCFNMMVEEAKAKHDTRSSEGCSSKSEEIQKTLQRQTSSTEMEIKKEITTYLSFPLYQKDEDPIGWWKVNKDSLPQLSKMANKFLCAPPSSVESERLFSIGGNVYTPHRNSLKPEAGERLMFMNYNLRAMDFEY